MQNNCLGKLCTPKCLARQRGLKSRGTPGEAATYSSSLGGASCNNKSISLSPRPQPGPRYVHTMHARTTLIIRWQSPTKIGDDQAIGWHHLHAHTYVELVSMTDDYDDHDGADDK